MKKSFLIISFVFAVSFLAACVAEDESVVKFGGPILQTENSDGSVDFNGAVENTADFPVQLVYVVIFIKDSDGNALAVTSVLVEEGDRLDPGKAFSSRQVSIIFPKRTIQEKYKYITTLWKSSLPSPVC